MSSEQLDKLEKLAGQRTDRSRAILARETQELALLDRHCRELRTLNHEYQNSLLCEAEVSPQSLAHRRAFVKQLAEKLDALAEQREQKNLSVEQKLLDHQQHTAQQAAIELVNESRSELHRQAVVRRDQQQLDASAQTQHIQQQHSEREQGND